VEPGFLEDGDAVLENFEPAAGARLELDADAGKLVR
jgi:hypothetical protein